MTRSHLSAALWPLIAGISGAAVVVASLAGPLQLTLRVTGVLAILIAVAAVAAAAQHRRFDRVGAVILGLGSLVTGIGQLAYDPASAPVTSPASAALGMGVIACAMPFFTVRSRHELITAQLQWSVLASSALIGLWVLETPGVRWSSGDEHHLALLTDMLLVVSGCGVLHGALAAASRPGRARYVIGAIATGLAFGFAGNVLTWLDPTDPTTVRASLALRAPGLGLVLAGCVAAAIEGTDGPRRPVLHRARDLTTLSLLTLVVVGGALVGQHPGGLDDTLAHTLASLVTLLVATHLHASHRTRTLTRSVEEQDHHLRLLVSESRDIIMELDQQGRVVFASDALRKVLGMQLEQLAGRPVRVVIPELDDDALAHVTYSPQARVQPTLRVESVIVTAGGNTVHAESVLTPLTAGYLVAIRDVSERVGLQSRLQQVTYHDVATGLPNRASLERELRHRLYEAATGDITLLLVDLNPAGLSDDSFRDEAHDDLLRQVGRTLRTAVRPGDVVCRFSDHRFAVLLRAGTTEDRGREIAEGLLARVLDPAHLPDVDVQACAALAHGGHSTTDIVRNAELALHQAQLAGSGSVRVFDAGMLAHFARTRDLRRRLARTPDTDRWTVLYQPVIDLATGRTSGVEALLRWTDPEGDLVGIEEIIRLAEEYGSIISIGSWVLDQAVAQAARWEAGGRPLQVAVNVSVHQLTAPGFLDIVEQTLERHDLPPQRLTLEITETVVLEQTEETIATLTDLRELGVRIAIDDFGTGYSGLANIRSLPLDILKIDRTFIQGLGQGGGDEAVVNAVTRLGHQLGLDITAEGIETREQEHHARALGITAAQGYLYARPLPATDVTALVARADAEAGRASVPVVDLPR